MKKREDIVTIRAIAIMLVVFGHSIILYSSAWNLYETSVQAPVLDHLKNVINVLQMPLFFSVSGFCLVFTLLRGGTQPVLTPVRSCGTSANAYSCHS